MAQFDEHAPQYKCCCGCCHVRVSLLKTRRENIIFQIGGLIIAVLMFVGSIIDIIIAAVNHRSVVVPVIGIALSLAVSVLLLMGILREIPRLMIPAIVVMVCVQFVKQNTSIRSLKSSC